MQTEPEINWRVLRDIIRQDMATYQGILVSHPEYHSSTKARVEGKIAAYQGVLDSMNTLEHGAASTEFGAHGEPVGPAQRCLNCGAHEGEDCKPWCAYKPEGRPMSLADVTQAACDTITKASAQDVCDTHGHNRAGECDTITKAAR